MRARQVALTLPAMVLAAVTVTSCGSAATGTPATGDPAGASPAPSATATSGPADPCAAFTAQDASAILNQPVGAGTPKSVTADAVSCLYQGKNDIVQTITVTLYSGALAQRVVSSFASQYQGFGAGAGRW